MKMTFVLHGLDRDLIVTSPTFVYKLYQGGSKRFSQFSV